MTNTQGFTPAPFPQLQQPAEQPQDHPTHPAAKKGKRRGPRPPKSAKPKRERKADKTKRVQMRAAAQAAPALPTGKKPRKPRALKVDLALAMSALSGLSEDDAKVVHSFVQALAPFSKKARERICGALVKVIA